MRLSKLLRRAATKIQNVDEVADRVNDLMDRHKEPEALTYLAKDVLKNEKLTKALDMLEDLQKLFGYAPQSIYELRREVSDMIHDKLSASFDKSDVEQVWSAL